MVELYTSEGCSSRPPADDRLDATFPRADAIAIACHVDHWNQLGWADPFSSVAHTTGSSAWPRVTVVTCTRPR